MHRGFARAAATAALLLAAGAAQAAVCDIPRALLCEGCASAIRVAVTPGGQCRITFTPGGTAQSLRLDIVREAAPRRAASQRWRRPVAARLAPAGGRCFVAADRRYCE
ncbi:MAG: hypothetical protein JNK46_09565 [Methylobacteriaceae bacterium]|nr:hypothetical protein [Methylobacteriaceae bacterium]